MMSLSVSSIIQNLDRLAETGWIETDEEITVHWIPDKHEQLSRQIDRRENNKQLQKPKKNIDR